MAKPKSGTGRDTLNSLQTTGAMSGKPSVIQSKSGAEVLQVIDVSECTDSLALEDFSQGKPPRTCLCPQKMPSSGCGSVGETHGALLEHRPGFDRPQHGRPG